MTTAAGRVIVVGSYVAGLTIRADRLPVIGETLIGTEFDNGPGGKGSNQAVQARRLGCEVEMVALIGRDTFGAVAERLWADEDVGTQFVARDDEATTGVAFITLDGTGANSIVVYPGANSLLSAADVERGARGLVPGDVVVAQQEIPEAAVAQAMRLGRAAGATTILNPAPARAVGSDILANVDILTPNASEARVLLGLDPAAAVDAGEIGMRLLAMGAGTVVLTLGGEGAMVVTPDSAEEIPPATVDVVDTTGAGDAFTGTLAAMLASGMELVDAVRASAIAGALTCTALGVIPALPTWQRSRHVASTSPPRRQGSGATLPRQARPRTRSSARRACARWKRSWPAISVKVNP